MESVTNDESMTEPRESSEAFGDVELEPHRSYKAPASVRRIASALGFRSPNDPETKRD
jgi:hypothetical protein